MKSVRNKIVTGIFVTTTILLGIALAFLAIDSQNNKDEVANNAEKITEYETKINELNNEVAKYKAQNVSTAKIETTEKVDLSVDLTKVKNSMSSTEKIAEYGYENIIIGGDYDSYIKLSNDGKVDISMGLDMIKHFLAQGSFGSSKIHANEIYNISGFSKKVVDVYLGNRSQMIEASIFLFLMEDGTVEYLTLEDFIVNGNTKSSGKIEGLYNIIKIKNSSVFFRNQQGEGRGGTRTPLAISSSGEIYDISQILTDTKAN